MKGIATIGGIITLLLLTGLTAMGEEDPANATAEEDVWAALDPTLITSKVEVKDISGKYVDVTQGAYIEMYENETTPYPYQEDGTFLWTIEQQGSLLMGTIEDNEGGIYQILGSTVMEDVYLVYYGPETDDGTNLLVEGLLDGNILESGEIVLNGIGYGYTIDPEDVDNYTFNEYYAETTILVPIDENIG